MVGGFQLLCYVLCHRHPPCKPFKHFLSLIINFTYITSHDAYRMHHPGAPRAALTKKPPKQKEPPRKGTKRWHKEQTRRRAAERRHAIRNVLALIDSLDTNYAARPAV